MEIVPYLNFNGQCEAAFAFYAQCLGGQVVAMVPFGEMPGQPMPDALKKLIMHARLVAGGAVLMGADTTPDRPVQPQGMSVSLHFDNPAEADRIFGALAEGGNVQMPIQQTFFATRFGMLVDKFGIPWMIDCQAAS